MKAFCRQINKLMASVRIFADINGEICELDISLTSVLASPKGRLKNHKISEVIIY